MTKEATDARAGVDADPAAPDVPEPAEDAAPEETAPEQAVPEETAPEQTEPEETEPEETEPEETEPAAPARPRARDKQRDQQRATEPRRAPARLTIPVVPVLAGLLVVLLGGVGYLWFTRPAPSSVHTADYAQVLEAARSEVVDLTSFDYLTLDQDIAQAKKIAVGDLQKESVDQLNHNRQQLTDAEAVVNTEVVGAGVVRADDSHGTVLLVIQSTQKTKSATQPQIVRYRIQVDLEKVHGRWLLSGISGR